MLLPVTFCTISCLQYIIISIPNYIFYFLVYVQNSTLPLHLYLQLHFLMQCLGRTDLRTFITEYALRSSLSFAGFLIDLHIHWADTQTFSTMNTFAFIAVNTQDYSTFNILYPTPICVWIYCVEFGPFSIFLRSIAIKTRSKAISLSQLFPQIFCIIKVCVKTFPTFLENKHSNLYSIHNTSPHMFFIGILLSQKFTTIFFPIHFD